MSREESPRHQNVPKCLLCFFPARGKKYLRRAQWRLSRPLMPSVHHSGTQTTQRDADRPGNSRPASALLVPACPLLHRWSLQKHACIYWHAKRAFKKVSSLQGPMAFLLPFRHRLCHTVYVKVKLPFSHTTPRYTGLCPRPGGICTNCQHTRWHRMHGRRRSQRCGKRQCAHLYVSRRRKPAISLRHTRWGRGDEL